MTGDVIDAHTSPSAAALMAQAGFDAIEIHLAHRSPVVVPEPPDSGSRCVLDHPEPIVASGPVA
jgi:hypothetical protein